MQETKVINMSEFIEAKTSKEATNQIHIQMLCYHGRSMVLMWRATGETRYLDQARLDLLRAKSIQECGFVRPIGVLLTA